MDYSGEILVWPAATQAEVENSAEYRLSRLNRLRHVWSNYTLSENWEAAAEVGRELVEQTPDDAITWLRTASVVALAGNEAAYREFCGRMAKRFAGADDALTTCMACLMLPDAIELARLPRNTLIKSLVDGTAPDWLLPHGWSTRALLAYRSGDAESSVKYVQKSEEYDLRERAHHLNLAIRALAQHQLGHADEARRDAEQASQMVIDRELKNDYDPFRHFDLLIVQILLREYGGLTASPP
jgi:hypothetical protein